MNVLETCQKVRACWDALFRSRYVRFLEAENARLRLKIERLELRALAFPGEAIAPNAAGQAAPFAVNRMRNSRSAIEKLHNRIWIESPGKSTDERQSDEIPA